MEALTIARAIRRHTAVSLIGLVAVVGCVPGYSVDVLSASPTGVSYEYTHSVGGEYQATIKKAEDHCQLYSKHAKPVGQPVILGTDRAVATFECVSAL